MLSVFFNIFDYVYNNIIYYYHIYAIFYKYSMIIRFYIQIYFNRFKYYTIIDKITFNILRFILFIYRIITRTFLWLNRRYIKKRKRFRMYYKFRNIRYWKFLLFFLYFNIFFALWKKRNLYRKSHFFLILIFTHIFILISLNFFVSIFNSFDIAFLSCFFLIYILVLLFKR